MITCLLYDIENDKARIKVAKYCKQAGLYRVQLSVFIGTLSKNEKDSLALSIDALIDTAKDKVYFFTMAKNDFQQSILLGQAFDQKLVTDEVRALFF